jgi:hypothetical protein
MKIQSLCIKLGLLAFMVLLARPDVVAALLPDASPSTATVEKQTVFTGTITCAKCDLKQSVKCATVLQIREGGRPTVYYFDPASNKKYHRFICVQSVRGTVTGELIEKGNQLTIQVKQVEFRK